MTPEPSAELFLGVDAGNSKTVAVVADAAGTVQGYARAGRGDIYGSPTEAEAVTEVMKAVQAALDQATTTRRVRRAAFCLAGLDWDSDRRYWAEQLDRLPWLDSYSLRNDGFALLRAGRSDGVGVALAAGTGAAVVGRGRAGQEWSASFWITHPIGGGALGGSAMRAVMRAELGLGPATTLKQTLLDVHGFDDMDSMLEGFTSRGRRWQQHAHAARAVLDAASAGEPVAVALVQEQAQAVADYLVIAMRKVDLASADVPVVLGGSVLTGDNPILRDAARRAIATVLPLAAVVVARRSPVVGAAAEAIAEGSGPLTEEILDRLAGHSYPIDFLLT